jgi:hypothetical protein
VAQEQTSTITGNLKAIEDDELSFNDLQELERQTGNIVENLRAVGEEA